MTAGLEKGQSTATTMMPTALFGRALVVIVEALGKGLLG